MALITIGTGVWHSKMLASRTSVKAIISFIFIMWAGAARPEAKEWRGITPLHSTRADVERLLGRPSTDRGFITFYYFEQERVAFSYAEGPCGVESSLWNVPRDTVTSIRVTPKQLSFADLKLDENKYKKKRNDHIRRVNHYINEEEGISYDVDMGAGGMVTAVEYFPAAKEDHLRCPASSEGLEETTKFDSYSDIPFESEKKRLDSFAEQARRYTSAQAYIMVYAGRRARTGEAETRAERAKGYLIKGHGIEAGRVVTIDGGHREDLTVELFLVPAGAHPPLSTPTVEPSSVQIIKVGSARNNRRSIRPRCKR